MGAVIALRDFLQIRADASSGRGIRQVRQTGFTPRDKADLEQWSRSERRAEICSCDTGVFAMLYVAGNAWASWGVVRRARGIALWNCVTLADIGRFPTMTQALAAIPTAEQPAIVENVLRFAGPRARAPRLGGCQGSANALTPERSSPMV